ncbi:MAG: redoxin domain-containing protein [Cryomorphaceae bacterium]|nr:redoxin domain-containing protein [Cryomorphaceae bacterium]
MALTPTSQIPLGFKAPDFSLQDVTSKEIITFEDIRGKNGSVVMFICNHCPYVVHLIDALVQLANDYQVKDIGFVAISANDIVLYPQDGPEKMVEFARERKFPFPYLFDESQDVAKAYDAACTPDFAVFNGKGICVYRGEFDGSRPSLDVPVDGSSIREVLDLLVRGEEPSPNGQKPSMGCNIKWKA